MKHNIITRSSAQKLLDKIMGAAAPVAVFARNGSWQSTKVTSDLFRASMQGSKARDLMGVYDDRATLDWLMDDLAHAGVK